MASANRSSDESEDEDTHVERPYRKKADRKRGWQKEKNPLPASKRARRRIDQDDPPEPQPSTSRHRTTNGDNQLPVVVPGTRDGFHGKTLRQFFGPFVSVRDLGNANFPSAVKLYGQVVLKYVSNAKIPKKRRLVIKLRDEKTKSSSDQPIFRLIAFGRDANLLKSQFRQGHNHIICGLNIQENKPDFNDTDVQWQGIMTANTFVHRLSNSKTEPKSAKVEYNLDTLVACVLNPVEKNRIFLIDLKIDSGRSQWCYVQGELVFKHSGIKDGMKWLAFCIRDQTATLRVVAFDSKAEELAKRGQLCYRSEYKLVLSGGRIEEANTDYPKSSTSVPVQFVLEYRTKVKKVEKNTKTKR